MERFDPTIEDAYRQQAEVDGVARMLEIYDTAGQEEFSSLRDTYIKGMMNRSLIWNFFTVFFCSRQRLRDFFWCILSQVFERFIMRKSC